MKNLKNKNDDEYIETIRTKHKELKSKHIYHVILDLSIGNGFFLFLLYLHYYTFKNLPAEGVLEQLAFPLGICFAVSILCQIGIMIVLSKKTIGDFKGDRKELLLLKYYDAANKKT